jgi:hypothetical protein
MTNTDSLGSGWENDCSAEEPDIFARRAKRRRRYTKSPPVQPKCPESPPIVICMSSLVPQLLRIFIASASESDSDSAWTRTYNRWKKRGPPRSTADTSTSKPSSSCPPGPPPSQARARPVWLDSDALESDDVDDAAHILRRSTTRYWQGVMQEVVDRFPHPDPKRRPTMATLLAPGMTRTRQYHLLCLVWLTSRSRKH